MEQFLKLILVILFLFTDTKNVDFYFLIVKLTHPSFRWAYKWGGVSGGARKFLKPEQNISFK
jgi:hypothetical protein